MDLIFSIEESPPWYAAILFGFQQQMTMFGGAMTYPFLVSIIICASHDGMITARIFSTLTFIISISTFLQTTFGVRLPIMQGPSTGFYVPALVFLSLPEWECPAHDIMNSTANINETIYVDVIGWQTRMQEIQGAIIVSSCVEVLLGLFGVMGFLLRFIGPLTVGPTIVMIGLGIYRVAALFSSGHWGISFLTAALIVLFSQYLRRIPVPIPVWTRSKGCHVKWPMLFNLFPVIMAISVSWFICYIFTASDVIPHGNRARTDYSTASVEKAPWIWFPLPGQWGAPRFSFALVVGMITGVLASIVESIGDYYACARLSGAPSPPPHAVNRGIAMEGLCCILAGIWGAGVGVTSYTENIGAIAITKVGSRRVMQWTSLVLLVSAVIGKVGAALSTLPLPIVGGALIVILGIITAAGAAHLQFVEMNSSRNLCIFGVAIFCGVMIPDHIESNPDIIDLGSKLADQIITVLLKTGMFVAGVIGFLLDNTIPGTPQERGIIRWKQLDVTQSRGQTEAIRKCYDLPFCSTRIRNRRWSYFVPICPGFMDK
ncbi:solute carrier family 23 member 1-like [Saccoglossus kowalevskii]